MDFQTTIDSEDELPSRTAKQQQAPAPRKKRKRGERETLEATSQQESVSASRDFDNAFIFDAFGGNTRPTKHQKDDFGDFDLDQMFKSKKTPTVSVDDIIARRRQTKPKTASEVDSASELASDAEIPSNDLSSDSEGSEDDMEVENGALGTDDEENDDSTDAHSESDQSVTMSQQQGLDTSNYFAEPSATAQKVVENEEMPPFSALPGAKLSRPVLLALSSMGLTTPTPIQAQTIPVVLMGKDVVGSSVTGSGKTVAFWVGVLERLLHRDKRSPKTRVVCLCPTRELAVQVCNVGKSLARHTDITFCLCVGGLSLKVQEAELKKRPDIVVSTPGRLIDHVRNTNSFSLDALEVLIIDEADRILEEGFKDELSEIVQYCPFNRSTLLFSATITEDVSELARLSLNKPVRIKIDDLGASSATLTQEFLRVRATEETEDNLKTREATLIAICRSTFHSRTIVFTRSKQSAHRLKILFGLMGLSADELHGDLSQEQRLQSLQRFKDGQTNYLLATDLASRGLDIKGVDYVINFQLPNSVDIYLHRVGRTARAGKTGRSLTLVGELDRKMVKQILKKASPDSIKQRKLEPEVVKTVALELAELEDDIKLVQEEEKEEKLLRRTEMELTKGQNMIQHAAEIHARPARTWFQSEKDKKQAKRASKEAANQSSSVKRETQLNHKQRRRAEALREAKMDGAASKSNANAAIRQAKKAGKAGKLTQMAPERTSGPAQSRKKKTGGSSFKEDAANRRPKAVGKQMRNGKKVSSVNAGLKKPGKASVKGKGGKRR